MAIARRSEPPHPVQLRSIHRRACKQTTKYVALTAPAGHELLVSPQPTQREASPGARLSATKQAAVEAVSGRSLQRSITLGHARQQTPLHLAVVAQHALRSTQQQNCATWCRNMNCFSCTRYTTHASSMHQQPPLTMSLQTLRRPRGGGVSLAVAFHNILWLSITS